MKKHHNILKLEPNFYEVYVIIIKVIVPISKEIIEILFEQGLIKTLCAETLRL